MLVAELQKQAQAHRALKTQVDHDGDTLPVIKYGPVKSDNMTRQGRFRDQKPKYGVLVMSHREI